MFAVTSLQRRLWKQHASQNKTNYDLKVKQDSGKKDVNTFIVKSVRQFEKRRLTAWCSPTAVLTVWPQPAAIIVHCIIAVNCNCSEWINCYHQQNIFTTQEHKKCKASSWTSYVTRPEYFRKTAGFPRTAAWCHPFIRPHPDCRCFFTTALLIILYRLLAFSCPALWMI